MVQYWRRGGFLRRAAEQGGWPRGAAIVVSLGAVSFGVFAAMGLITLGTAGWLVGGLAGVILIMTSKANPAPPRDSIRPQSGE